MIPKYEVFELTLSGPEEGNPFVDVDLTADFSCGADKRTVSGFYDENETYRIRFMPDAEGQWSYLTHSNCDMLDNLTGTFTCIPALPDQHGPVRVRDTFHFAYDDGTPYYPFGTTAYNWINQPQETIKKTIQTLSEHSFNKIRMGGFPKCYAFNLDDPERYPFVGGRNPDSKSPPPDFLQMFMWAEFDAYRFDLTRFDVEWWRHFEWCISQMAALDIQVDLIVFHPYDRWGFSKMTEEENLRYLRYLVARVGAYSNIWWSMANEWDCIPSKSEAQWEIYASEIQKWDASRHLCSIHNCTKEYDYHRPWITHVSWQRIDYYSHVELVDKMRETWQKPIVVDEICYEGNVDSGWGNITGEELTRRFWEVSVRGGYCTHGETYLRENNILWWAKGGELTGSSPARIAFLRRILEDMGGIDPDPTHKDWDAVWGHSGNPIPVSMDTPFGEMTINMTTDMICYFGFSRPAFRNFRLPQETKYKVDIIDTWNMTVSTLPGTYSGETRIDLPGTTYIAVRFRAVDLN